MSGIECAFTGRVGRDAELKYVKGGELPLLTCTVAVDQQHQGENNPPTWIRLATFGDLAEQMAERLVKGTRVYVEGRLEASIWTPGNGREPQLNLNLTATTVQPIGQIWRQRPKQTGNGERSQRTWDRSRDAGRAGEAMLAAARRDSSCRRDSSEPPDAWLDDSRAAIADLVHGPRL